MNLTAVAAFLAAGLSLVNVLISSRFVRRGQLEQWRRDAERPIVASVLVLSDKCLALVSEAADQKATWIRSLNAGQENIEARALMAKLWDTAALSFDDLRVEGAQLELIAGRDLQLAVEDLLRLHEGLRHVVRPAGGAESPDEVARDYGGRISIKRADLVHRARADLGL